MNKTDKDIALEFKDFTITKITFNDSGRSGYIDLHFPNSGDHVSGGQELESDVCDSFIIYDNGVIAFNSWYPDNVYIEICKAITNSKI